MSATALPADRSPNLSRWVTPWSVALCSSAFGLSLLQVMSGTSWRFAGLVLVFHFLVLATIKALGGITNLLGLCVAVLSLQHVTVAMVAKVYFWSPADTPLITPLATMSMYILGMLAVLLAALTMKWTGVYRIRPLMPTTEDVRRLQYLAIAFTVLMVIRGVVLQVFGLGIIGGVIGPLRQMTFLAPLAVAIGTAAVILGSQGKRSISVWNGCAILITMAVGMLGAARAETANVLVVYVITCFAFGFKFRPVHFLGGLVLLYVLQFILFPYAAYMKGQPPLLDVGERVSRAVDVLADVVANPAEYRERQVATPNVTYARKRTFYYGDPIPTLDRYSVLIWTDVIVDVAQREGGIGPKTILWGFEMILPRFIYADKPALSSSNFIAQRGRGALVNEEDITTGITLGFFVDGMSSYEWWGVFLCSYAFSLLFFLVHALIIDTRLARNPYSICLVFSISWIFSEGTLQSLIVTTLFASLLYAAVVVATNMVVSTVLARRSRDMFVYESRPVEGAAP